jgi:hypothetical protein
LPLSIRSLTLVSMSMGHPHDLLEVSKPVRGHVLLQPTAYLAEHLEATAADALPIWTALARPSCTPDVPGALDPPDPDDRKFDGLAQLVHALRRGLDRRAGQPPVRLNSIGLRLDGYGHRLDGVDATMASPPPPPPHGDASSRWVFGVSFAITGCGPPL